MKSKILRSDVDLTIEKLVAGGDGLAFLDGKAVFVPGVLPAERVRARLVEERGDYARAALLEVMSPSPARVEPPCPLAGVCGGCDWLHIRYEEQLSLKKAIVAEALRRVGRIEAGELEIEPSPPLGYRNRAQIHRDEEGRLGFMGFRSDRVVPVESCPVAVPAVNRLFHDPPPAGPARFAVFGEGERLAFQGDGDEEDLEVTVHSKRILFSVGCFFQSNLAALEKLLPFAVEGMAGGDRADQGAGPRIAADLYCGVGVFAAHLADRFQRIIAVESDPRSAAYARRNVPGVANEVYALTVEQWISSASSGAAIEAVIVDPPRAGLSRPVREYLSAAAPRKLVYVSCNPVTLARDLSLLLAGPYRLQDLRLFDFFPQTSHVESVARLERKEAPGHSRGAHALSSV